MGNSVCKGRNSIVIGVNNTCDHDNCILIGNGLTSEKDYEIRIGNDECCRSGLMSELDFDEFRSALFSIINGGYRDE